MSDMPKHGDGAATHTPANMARWWGMCPAGAAAGLSHGLSAALWDLNSPAPMEIAAPPDPATNIVSCVVAGSVASEMSLDGRTLYRQIVPEGTFNLVRAGEQPRAVLDWAACSILHLYLPEAVLQHTADDVSHGNSSTVELLPIKVETDPGIKALADAIVREMRGLASATRLMVDGLTLQLTALMIRGWSNHSKQVGRHQSRLSVTPADWRVRRAIELLESRFSDDLGLDEVANSVGLSAGHFAALFRQATSLPPHRWLVRRRIEHACGMLSDPRRIVTDIAHACGFASSQHLSTVFRTHMGTTPTLYRKAKLA